MPLNIMVTKPEELCKDLLPNLKFMITSTLTSYPCSYAYHLSNGESVEHITIEPAGNGKKIHAYRDGVFTQGDERRSKRDLFVRAKAPKVSFHLEKGKLSSKDRQLAEEQAEDALKHYGYKAGTVV
jgi:hypothetical protein